MSTWSWSWWLNVQTVPGNLVPEILIGGLAYVVGRIHLKRIVATAQAHHAERLAQAAEHHEAQLAHAEHLHHRLVTHLKETRPVADTDLDRILARIAYDPRADTGLVGAKAGPRPDPIPWPTGLAPKRIGGPAADDEPLPKADVLIVTYTTAEGHALADVLTPGSDTTAWTEYRNGWPTIKAMITGGRAPSLHSDRAGLWAVVQIGKKRVVVVKSDLHPSTDGPNLPMAALWRQMIAQVKPALVITTGTAGGVGAGVELGDVIVAQNVKWNCEKQFAGKPFAHASYPCQTPPLGHMTFAESTLLPVNAGQIPAQYRTRPLAIVLGHDTETTDFFAFDDKADHYGLRKYDPASAAVEMDDAALGLALAGTTGAPAWVSVRNASDPQMNEATLAIEDKDAANIYEKYGYWTTIGSAITCWAIVAGMGS